MTDNTTGATKIKLWIAIDDAGKFRVSTDDAQDALETLVYMNDCNATCVYAIKLLVPMPKTVKVATTLPNTDGPVTVTVT